VERWQRSRLGRSLALPGTARKYGLENVAHLDELPAKGFGVIVAPIKIDGGTGGPTRIRAVLNKTSGERET
jgi:kynurenine formamidase